MGQIRDFQPRKDKARFSPFADVPRIGDVPVSDLPAHDVAGFCGLAATIDGHDFTALPQVTAASVFGASDLSGAG